MASSSTITLLSVMEWAKRLNFDRRSALGNSLEPALTSANLILQTILGAPFAWRWNRVNIGFMTVAGQQDYTVFNYAASTAVKLGWFTVDDAGNSQVCTTAGTTGASAPTWNHTLNDNTTDGSVTWTNKGSLHFSQVQDTYTFGWVETSSVLDVKNSWKALTSKIVLELESGLGRPGFVAAQTDDGLGNVTFRLMACPDQAYPVVLTIQQKPPLFTSVNQVWSPIPNEYSRLYQWGFLSLMYLFADDPRFQTANAKFVSALLGSSEGLDETQRNIFLHNWEQVTGQPLANSDRMQQAFQARGQ